MVEKLQVCPGITVLPMGHYRRVYGGRGSALGLMLGLISIWRPAGKLRLWAQ